MTLFLLACLTYLVNFFQVRFYFRRTKQNASCYELRNCALAVLIFSPFTIWFMFFACIALCNQDLNDIFWITAMGFLGVLRYFFGKLCKLIYILIWPVLSILRWVFRIIHLVIIYIRIEFRDQTRWEDAVLDRILASSIIYGFDADMHHHRLYYGSRWAALSIECEQLFMRPYDQRKVLVCSLADPGMMAVVRRVVKDLKIDGN